MRPVSGTFRKWFIAILLALCVGIHVFELSGRWDRTFQDANDEAGIVAAVLCIGVAVSVAGTVLKRLFTRTICQMVVTVCTTARWVYEVRIAVAITVASPPILPLRI